jgi:hypothetical protein
MFGFPAKTDRVDRFGHRRDHIAGKDAARAPQAIETCASFGSTDGTLING